MVWRGRRDAAIFFFIVFFFKRRVGERSSFRVLSLGKSWSDWRFWGLLSFYRLLLRHVGLLVTDGFL